MAPFYGRGSTASRLEPLRGGCLLFTIFTIFTTKYLLQRSLMNWHILLAHVKKQSELKSRFLS